MLRTKSASNWLTRSAIAACATFALVAPASAATVLLNDTWADGSRAETNLPTESQVWTSAAANLTMAPGKLIFAQDTSSRRIHTYFTPSSAYNLANGEYLKGSMTFNPTAGLSTNHTSRSFRFGIFGDDSARVTTDGYGDGGTSNVWANATGYATFVHISDGGGSGASTAAFQIGKRTGSSNSLLGSTGDFQLVSGGDPIALTANTAYRLELNIARINASLVEVTASIYQGATLLSSFTAADNGTTLGGLAPYNGFDLFAYRNSTSASTASTFEFTNFYVETGAIPEPASLGLLALGGLTLLRRRHA